MLCWGGHVREAEEHLRKTVALAPNFAFGRYRLGTFLVEPGNYKGGPAELEAAASLSATAMNLSTLAAAYALSGNRCQALKRISRCSEVETQAQLDLARIVRLGSEHPKRLRALQVSRRI